MANRVTVGKAGWYHGWNIVAVCVLGGIAASSLPVNGFSLFLVGWSKDLHVTFSTATLGITCFGLGSAALSPLAGLITDRLPSRLILSAGVCGVALFYISMSYVTHIWEYLALYGVLGPISALTATGIPANAVVMRWFVKRMGLALGLTSMGLSMAGIVIPPIIAALLPHLGWRLIWRFGGIFIAAAVLPLILLVVRERPTEREGLHYLTAAGAAPVHHGHATGSGSSLTWVEILKRRNFWMLVISYLSMLIMYGGAGYNLTPIAASRGSSAQLSSYLLSGWALAQMLATLGGGMVSDKFGNRVPLAFLCFLTAFGGVVVAFGQGLAVLMIGALLVGVGGGFWPLVASALAAEFGAAGFGRAFGTLMLFLPIGTTPAFLVAKSWEIYGSYVPVLLAFAVLSGIGGIASLLIRERRGGQITPQEEARVEEATVPLL